MNTQTITSERIYYAFLSGAAAVIKGKKELNKINVFPVPDGDTGTNLAFTMNAIIEESRLDQSVKRTLESISTAALTGARGNSGIIFAQFINGLYMGVEDKKEVSIYSFSDAVKEAVDYAYKSITNPVEGTMITVMKDWAESLHSLKVRTKDFTEVLSASLIVALQSVKNTPEILKVLKDNSVVDAGAKGFFYFIEGFVQFIKSGEMNKMEYDFEQIKLEAAATHVNCEVDLSHRYCTEALVKGENLDLEEIRSALTHIGDSLIVAGNANRVRIHVHTNSPPDVFHKIKDFGQIIQQKADDMVRQYESGFARKNKIGLVTDSIADLPKDLMDHHQIHMLPLNLLVEDSVYLDKMTISPSYLYQLMDESENYPKSSQPTSKAVEEFLSAIAANYESIIVITVSKRMSGTHDTFTKVAKKMSEEGTKITIIDSKLNSGGQGLVVLKGAEEIESGKRHEEIVNQIQNTIKKTSIFVSVKTLKYMVRSGRVKKAQGIAAKLLNLKPVVSIDEHGDGIIIGKVFSDKANLKKLVALVKDISATKEIISYAIVHADAKDQALKYEKLFTEMIGKSPTYTTTISSIVAMNAGIGCVAIALTTK